MSGDILVLGIGNLLLTDDGVGVHAARVLLQRAPAGMAVVEVGTAILRAEHLLEDHSRIIAFDALKAGGPAGSLYLTTLDQIDASGPKATLHDLGLAALARIAGRDVAEILVIAAEPGTIEIGTDLTPALVATCERMVATAISAARLWKSGSSASDVLSALLHEKSNERR